MTDKVDTTPGTDRHQRPALEVLSQLRRGRLATELTEALDELLVAVQDTGKAGTLTLKLTVKPQKVNDYETARVEVSDDIAVRRPRRAALPSTFYLTDDSVLSRRDPHQDELPTLRGVDDDADAAITGKAARA